MPNISDINLRMQPNQGMQPNRFNRIRQVVQDTVNQRERLKEQQRENKWTRRGRLLQAVGATLQDVSTALKGGQGTALSDFIAQQQEYNEELMKKAGAIPRSRLAEVARQFGEEGLEAKFTPNRYGFEVSGVTPVGERKLSDIYNEAQQDAKARIGTDPESGVLLEPGKYYDYVSKRFRQLAKAFGYEEDEISDFIFYISPGQESVSEPGETGLSPIEGQPSLSYEEGRGSVRNKAIDWLKANKAPEKGHPIVEENIQAVIEKFGW